ncbi:MAG: Ig-like domain-containing protein [Paramuribaculum sp.]|nr:Ig-like domain-containing protein [Paramuribaculum sp.]
MLAVLMLACLHLQAQQEYVYNLVVNQLCSVKEDLGTGIIDGTEKRELSWWYTIDDITKESWTATITYPRGGTGWQPAADGQPPVTPYTFSWPGWACIRHNGQVFYPSVFSSTIDDDFEIFTPAVTFSESPALQNAGGKIIPTKVVKIGDYALYGSEIEYLTLVESDMMVYQNSLEEIGDYAFAECRRFRGIPEGSHYRVVPHSVKVLGRGVFKNCSAMERMIIGDGVEVIPEETFDGCVSLRELKLGASVKRVECSIAGLKRLVVSAPEPPEIADGYAVYAEEIWVPAEYLSVYKSAWSGRNIKGYKLELSAPHRMFAGAQCEVYINRLTPGLENDVVYGYPFEGSVKWSVDSIHGSDAPSGKFKSVGYRYAMATMNQSALDAGNVLYEDRALLRFSRSGKQTLTFTTLDITDCSKSIELQIEPYPAGDYSPLSGYQIKQNPVKDHTLGVNATRQLTVFTSGTNIIAGSKWETNNPGIATVSQTGLVTGISPGIAYITAYSLDPRPSLTGSRNKDTYMVIVERKIENFVPQQHFGNKKVDIPYDGLYRVFIPVGEKIKVSPRFEPEGARADTVYYSKNMPYTSEGVVNADLEYSVRNGEVEIAGLSTGIAQINIAINTPDAVRHIEKPLQVHVIEPKEISEITLSKATNGEQLNEYNGIVGKADNEHTIQLDYNFDAGIKRVIWSSDNPDVAEVLTEDGISARADIVEPMFQATLRLKRPGFAMITATAADGSGVTKSFPVNVSDNSVRVNVKQTVAADNGSVRGVEISNDWYFFLHDDGTATLTYPSADPVGEPSFPDNPYDVSYHGYYCYRSLGAYAQLWSEIVEQYNPNKDLFFVALRIPGEITYEGKSYKVTEIGDYALAGSNIGYIHVPSSIERIGNYAFKDAKTFEGLAGVSNYRVVPNSVKSLGKGVFSGCTKMTRMIIGDGVEVIPEETFDGSAISTLELGSSVRQINCDMALGVLIFSSPAMPEVKDGVRIECNRAYAPAKSIADYKERFPEMEFSSGVLTVSPTEYTAYVYEEQSIHYTHSGLHSGACEYLAYYPAYLNGKRGFSWTNNGSKQTNDFFTLEFSDITAVASASEIRSTANSFYLSYATPGVHTLTVRDIDLTHNTATVTVTVLPGKAVKSVTLAADKDIINVGETLAIKSTVLPADATDPSLRWELSAPGIVEIDENGSIKGLAPGTVTVRAYSMDPNCPEKKSNSLEITVVRAVESIRITENGTEIPASGLSGYPGEKFEVSAEYLPEGTEPTECGWSIASSVASVSGEGKDAVIELQSPGRALAVFAIKQAVGEQEMSVDVPILVKTAVSEISLAVNGNALGATDDVNGVTDTEVEIKATVNAQATDKGLVWSSSNADIVGIAETADGCRLVMKAAGRAVVTVVAADGQGAKRSVVVIVKDPEIPEVPVSEIKVSIDGSENKTSVSGYPGDKFTMSAEYLPAEATPAECSWKSSDESTAKVEGFDCDAEVELMASGEAVLTFVLRQNTDGSLMTVDIPVEVKTPVKEIILEIDGSSEDISGGITGDIGDEIVILASVNDDASDKNLVWESSDENVAEVEPIAAGCKIVLKGEGTARVTVSSKDGKSQTYEFTVTAKKGDGSIKPIEPGNPDDPDVKVESVDINISEHTGNPGDKIQLTVVVMPENATDKTIIWKSSNPDVAAVDANGEIELKSEGEAMITGTTADGSGITVECRVKVKKPQSSINGVGADGVKVSNESGCLVVSGLNDGDIVMVYSSAGQLVAKGKASGGAVVMDIPAHGIFIAVTPAGSVKFRN